MKRNKKCGNKNLEPERVLMVLSSVSIGGGVQTKIMDIYRKVDKSRVQFDFLVHTYDPNEKSFKGEIESLGGKIFFFGRVKDIGLYSYIKSLYKLIKHGNYKAVHSYIGILDGLILFIAKILNVQIRISHVRTIFRNTGKKKLLHPLLKYLIIKSHTHLLASSTQAGKSLYGKKKFEVIPNPIDVEKYFNINNMKLRHLKEKLNISKDEIVLGHVGRFSWEKNHEFLLKICLILKKKSIPFKLILVGDGELRDEIEKKVNKIGLDKSILFVGAQTNPEYYYRLFDIFLFPSLYEGFGNVVIEAQISNNFVIASNAITSETDLGLGLIKYLSLEKIDDWIDAILKCSYPPKKISEIETKKVINERFFSIEKNIEKYYSIYDV